MFPLLLILPSVIPQQVCYPPVFIHSEGHLPSTAPFCLVVRNDETEEAFTPPNPITTRQEWEDFARENNVVQGQVGTREDDVIRLNSDLSPWLLPSALTPLCTHSLPLRVRDDFNVVCRPFHTLNAAQCQSTALSAPSLLTNDLTLLSMNTSIAINSTFEIRTPTWINGACADVPSEIQLVILLTSNSSLSSVIVSRLQYTTVSPSNASTVTLSLGVRFTEEDEEWNLGYEEGDEIEINDGNGVWSIPEGMDCSGRRTVKFQEETVVTCSISVSSCSTGMNAISSLLSSLPSSFLDRPFPDPDSRFIPLTSLPSSDTSSSSSNTCTITSAVSLTVTHSLSGPVLQSKRVLTSVIAVADQVSFPIIPSNFTFLFSLRFVDVTPGVSYTFATPPRIDLRLPADFFYPFLYNSFPSLYCLTSNCVIALFLCTNLI